MEVWDIKFKGLYKVQKQVSAMRKINTYFSFLNSLPNQQRKSLKMSLWITTIIKFLVHSTTINGPISRNTTHQKITPN